MVKGPVYSGSESAVLVVGDSLVKYVGDVRCDLEVVSLPGRGVESVAEWVLENLKLRHKLVLVHVGTNELASKGASVLELYGMLCALNDSMPPGVHLCVSELFRRWDSCLPDCWYTLSPARLARFNHDVFTLNSLLNHSYFFVLGHHERFTYSRCEFAMDGVHLNRSGSIKLTEEMGQYAQKWQVGLKNCVSFKTLCLTMLYSVITIALAKIMRLFCLIVYCALLWVILS